MANQSSAWSFRPLARRLVALALLATAALLAAYIVTPAHLGTDLLLYLLLLTALAVWLLVRISARAHPGATDAKFQAALRRPSARSLQPESLHQLERQLTYARTSSFDLHYRLRPLLREIAGQRLAARRNVSLDGQPERAATLLGPDAWDLLRPDRPPPADRHAPGLDRTALATIVAALEGI